MIQISDVRSQISDVEDNPDLAALQISDI